MAFKHSLKYFYYFQMPRKCCVPGCKSNYDSSNESYVNVFSFPKDEEMCKKWLRSIHRENYVLTKESVVCIKHFDDSFIIREHRALRPDGSELVMPRKVPILKSDAYPTIFKELPTYLSTLPPVQRRDPAERLRVQDERNEEAFMQQLAKDCIEDFDDFNKGIGSRLPNNWILFNTNDCTCIAKFDESSFPKFPVSIRISSDLTVKVWTNGIIIASTSLKWLFGSEQKCLHWSTFDSLISYFANYASSSNPDDKIRSAISVLNDYLSACTDTTKQDKISFCVEQLTLCVCVPKYSSYLMIWAAAIYYTYMCIQNSNKLTLPRISYLKRLLQQMGKLHSGLSGTVLQYLKGKNQRKNS